MAQQESQIYDRALKSLLGDEAAEILPRLIDDVILLGEQNIEIDRTTLKADLVYNVLHKGKSCIMSLELQTGSSTNMEIRLLQYHVGLHDKHKLPVISVVMYPFETSIPTSPYVVNIDDEVVLIFHFRVLRLWLLDARRFVQDHTIAMYTLLPAMKNVSASFLIEAVDEMKKHYAPRQFAEHLARFKTILERSTTLSKQEKMIVEEQIQEYNSLVEESTFFQNMVRRKNVEVSVQTAQRIVTTIVETRFPELTRLAQERVVLIRNVDSLDQLVKQLVVAPNETAAKELLNTVAAA